MKKELKWDYAISEFKYHGCLLNPDKLPEGIREEYIKALNQFFESFAKIIKIHAINPKISEKAYREVFGNKGGK